MKRRGGRGGNGSVSNSGGAGGRRNAVGYRGRSVSEGGITATTMAATEGRGGGSSTARQALHALTSGRIRKSANKTPKDREGDVSMLAAAVAAAAAAGGEGDGLRKGRRAVEKLKDVIPNPIVVKITGYHGDTEEAFLSFLKRKVTGLKYSSEVQRDASGLYLQVPNRRMALQIVGLNGRSFAGNLLSIQIIDNNSSTPTSAATTDTIEILRAFLAKRWDTNNRLLDLSGIHHDANMRRLYITPNDLKASENKMFRALIKLAEEDHISPSSIDLAGNNLSDVRGVSFLSIVFPNLQRLSLSNNAIAEVNDLSVWQAPGKFRYLRELSLLNTPLRDKEIVQVGGEQAYQTRFKQWFPALEVLDGSRVEEGLQQHLPLPIRPGLMQDAGVRATAEIFLAKYFEHFDNKGNRPMLANIYTPTATFSYCINTYAAIPKFDNAWLAHSRNLQRGVSNQEQNKYLSQNRPQIIQSFQIIPLLQHNLSDDPSKLLVDALWADIGIPDTRGIIVTCHGTLTEQKSKIIRSFDRTFIIAPLTPASQVDPGHASALGIQCCIVSDLWTIRSHVGDLPVPPPQSVAPLVEATIPAAIPPPPRFVTSPQPLNNDPTISIITPAPSPNLSNIPADRQGMINLVRSQSGMNEKYAVLALEQNNWDLNVTVERVMAFKSQGIIPPEAFAMA